MLIIDVINQSNDTAINKIIEEDKFVLDQCSQPDLQKESIVTYICIKY